MPTPPEALLNLNFDTLKTEVTNVTHAIETAIGFVDKFGWFIPAQYKTALDELLKILQWVDNALDKMP